MYDIAFINGASAGIVIPTVDDMTMGRNPSCTLEIPDPNASRAHCRIFFNDGDTLLEDLKSANGTFINETPCEKDVILQSGDIIRIGETRMRVQLQASANLSVTSSSSVLLNNSSVVLEESGKDMSEIDLSMSMLDISVASDHGDESMAQKRLKAVLDVSEALASIKSLELLFNSTLSTLCGVFPQLDRGLILLGDTIENLRCVVSKNKDGTNDLNATISKSLCKAALEKKEILVYKDDGSADFDQGLSLVSLSIRSAMVVPLMVKDEILGLLFIDTKNPSKSFSKDDMSLAAAVCRQIAAAVKNTMLMEQIEAEAGQRRNLMRFLPKPLVDQFVGGEVNLELGGKNYEGTVMFSDIVGFTRMSEKLSPENLVTLMNNYFDRMIPCIESVQGAIDKFMGDCIMAFWGIPFNDEKSSNNAIIAALNMQITLAAFNATQTLSGEPTLSTAIGINTGPVTAGNIGGADRAEYTVLGDTVNTAQRIESKSCYEQILIGEETFAKNKDYLIAVKMLPVEVKNKARPIQTYSARGLKIADEEMLLNIPVFIGQHEGTIIRKLANKNFIVYHHLNLNINNLEIKSRIVELKTVSYGKATVIENIPLQSSDGGLQRTVIQLDDNTLDGLLLRVIPSDKEWKNLSRSKTAF